MDFSSPATLLCSIGAAIVAAVFALAVKLPDAAIRLHVVMRLPLAIAVSVAAGSIGGAIWQRSQMCACTGAGVSGQHLPTWLFLFVVAVGAAIWAAAAFAEVVVLESKGTDRAE